MGEMRADGAKIKDQSGIFALLVLYLRYFCDHLRFCTLFMPFLSLFPLYLAQILPRLRYILLFLCVFCSFFCRFFAHFFLIF